jgi:hypothetical protein
VFCQTPLKQRTGASHWVVGGKRDDEQRVRLKWPAHSNLPASIHSSIAKVQTYVIFGVFVCLTH